MPFSDILGQATNLVNAGIDNYAKIVAAQKQLGGATLGTPSVIYKPTVVQSSAPLTTNEKVGLGILAGLGVLILAFLLWRK